MIALCAEHHAKADAGSFTTEQLREMKHASGDTIVGRFDWLRHDVLAVVGGNFYHETPVIFQHKGEKAIWFERDEDHHLMLSIRMVSASNSPRLRLENNDWILRGDPVDFESPPTGRRIHARYDNDDELAVEFIERRTSDEGRARYPFARSDMWSRLSFPITGVEVLERIGGRDTGFGPTWTRLGGFQISGHFTSRCGVGLSWG